MIEIMLFGCCLNLLAKGSDYIGVDYLELIATAGYDFVEMPLAQIMRLSDDEFDNLCHLIDQAGIPCRCCNNFFPGRDIPVTGHHADEMAIRSYLEKSLERARKMDAGVVVFGSPSCRNVENDYPRELAMMQMIRSLQLMGEYAVPDLQIAIEHVCHLEGNLIYTLNEACLLQKVCCHPRVGVLADSYHMAVEKEPLEDLYLVKNSLLHVHISNPVGRLFPKPNDGIDYAKFLHILKDINYTRGVSVEAFTDNPEEDIPVALKTLRQACL